MITFVQAIILGLVQGLTELFPISSLGHSVIIPALLGWHIDQSTDLFLVFLVAVHFATALALVIFFWADWVLIVRGFFRSFKKGGMAEPHSKLAWLLIVGTVPAGLIGLIFQNKIQGLFASPRLVAFVLILNGLMLWALETMHRHSNKGKGSDSVTRLTWSQSFGVGVAQALALIPGFSRTGSAMAGGKLAGLSEEASANFAFLLATPIIFAAALLKLPELARYVLHGGISAVGPLLIGAIFAFVAAYLSTRFLVRYFKTKNLMPFAVYCMLFGAFALIVLFFLR